MEKDGLSYRVYHNTTARYNGFFYARESLKEAMKKLLDSHQEDYDNILPPYIYGTEESARGVYPQLERVIEKSSKVVDRHTMKPSEREKKKMKKPEMNKWIDDNYFLIGKGYFYKRNYYKAEEIFKYCARKFKEPEMEVTASVWLARTFMELGDYNSANKELVKAGGPKNIDDDVRAEYHMVAADYHIRNEDFKKAAEEMESAIGFIRKKKDRARPTFILAQLYQALEEAQKAIDMYETVLTLKPEYELEFYAQINQALAFSRKGGNSIVIKEKLEKMLKDDKNIDYRDQIYYALAGVFLEERNTDEGISNLELSLGENKGNTKQRGKSYLKLADVYFEERDYPASQAYYDSALTLIDDKHPRYKDIRNMAESLTDLVKNLEIISREDSLQKLAGLSPEDLDAKLDKIIKQLEEEEERKRREAEEAQNAAMDANLGGVQSNWAFYNRSLLVSGYNNFQSVWGDRPLEDNWRRSKKMTMGGGAAEEEIVEELAKDDPKSLIPGKEELAEGIPNSPDEIAKSNEAMAKAYYNCGLIYKEKLDDFENAVEAFEILADRFETSEYHLLACYQLYRAYLAKEQEGYTNPFCSTCNSKYWGDQVLNLYPDSEYAMLIRNPEFKSVEAMKKSEEETAYLAALQQFRDRNYPEVIQRSGMVISDEPGNHLLPKYYFLRAMATGAIDKQTGERENYIARLKEVVEKFAETEEGIRAKEFLDILLGGVAKEGAAPEVPVEEEKKAEYTFEEQGEYYFAIVFNRDKGNFNEIKARISDFCAEAYASAGLKTSSNLIDKDKHIVIVKTFDGMANAMEFYLTFTANKESLTELNKEGFDRFIITKKNYVTLFKEKDLPGYLTFFAENYMQ